MTAPSKRFQRIYVEISNICNLKCSFCPPVIRDKKVMSLESFLLILPQLTPLTDQVCLHLMGEPLGHPHFDKIVQATAQQGLRINLTTNGTLISPRHYQTLCHPAISQINFSVHSYPDNFPHKPLQPYLAKLLDFYDHMITQRLDMYVNFRLWNLPSPTSELQQDPLNQQVIDYIEERMGFVQPERALDLRRHKVRKIRPRFGLHFDTRFIWPSLDQEVRQTKGTCRALTQHIGIHADGTVVPCCLDKEAAAPLGNIFQQSLAKILRSSPAKDILFGFQQGQLIHPLCQRCQYATRFQVKSKNKSVSPVVNSAMVG